MSGGQVSREWSRNLSNQIRSSLRASTNGCDEGNSPIFDVDMSDLEMDVLDKAEPSL